MCFNKGGGVSLTGITGDVLTEIEVNKDKVVKMMGALDVNIKAAAGPDGILN